MCCFVDPEFMSSVHYDIDQRDCEGWVDDLNSCILVVNGVVDIIMAV